VGNVFDDFGVEGLSISVEDGVAIDVCPEEVAAVDRAALLGP
jgi:hypothetical protein